MHASQCRLYVRLHGIVPAQAEAPGGQQVDPEPRARQLAAPKPTARQCTASQHIILCRERSCDRRRRYSVSLTGQRAAPAASWQRGIVQPAEAHEAELLRRFIRRLGILAVRSLRAGPARPGRYRFRGQPQHQNFWQAGPQNALRPCVKMGHQGTA